MPSYFLGIFGGSVYVPNEGWFVFGGLSSKLTHAQKLATIDDAWEEGPELYNGKSDYYHCLVQVRTAPAY